MTTASEQFEPRLPRTASVIAAVIVVGFFAVLVAITGLVFYGDWDRFGNVLVILSVGFGVLSSKFGTVVDFLFGSSWGSRTKDALVVPARPVPATPLPQPAQLPLALPPPTPALEPHRDVSGIGRSTDPSVINKRRDIKYDGTPASIRYHNVGAAWENDRAHLFGMLGYGILKDGNHIAQFPHPVNGAAYNFDIIDHYAGLTVAKARKKWTNDVSFLSGYDPDMVITHEFVRDPKTAIPFMKAVGHWEAGRDYPLDNEGWAEAHAMFLAGSADAWLDGTNQQASVKLPAAGNKFDLAEALVAAYDRKGYRLDRNPGEVNIAYVEGMNEDGTLNNDAPDKWNDLRVVFGFEGDKPVILGKWQATTEPGRYYTDNPVNAAGAARIAFNQFTAWQVGIHRGDHEALVQRAPVTVYRDLNRDMKRTGDKTDTGMFGINQHGGYDLSESSIGKASAGCLVGRTMAGQKAFMSIVKSDLRYLRDKGFLFPTAILAERDVVPA